MSAMAAIIKDDRIHVLSDAVFYDSDTGVVAGFDMKIWPVARLNAVFSSRGIKLASSVFSAICSRMDFETFDDLAALLPDVMETFDAHMGGNAAEIMVAGFSESRQRPEVYVWISHAGGGDDLHRKTVYFFLEGCIQFGLCLEQWPTASEFEPERDALPIFEGARRRVMDLQCGQAAQEVLGHSIGGALCHVELTATSATGKILHRWPDRIGERIDPFQPDTTHALEHADALN